MAMLWSLQLPEKIPYSHKIIKFFQKILNSIKHYYLLFLYFLWKSFNFKRINTNFCLTKEYFWHPPKGDAKVKKLLMSHALYLPFILRLTNCPVSWSFFTVLKLGPSQNSCVKLIEAFKLRVYHRILRISWREEITNQYCKLEFLGNVSK